jgi:serine/threonine protein kinase
MALESARAMNYLHQNKPPLLHKSLSSINILIDKELVAKVSDYGLDNLRGAARKNGMIQPLWIAPEVFKKNKHSMASDVYSFGIILWELVTRKTPYGGKINANNLKAIKVLAFNHLALAMALTHSLTYLYHNDNRILRQAHCVPRYRLTVHHQWQH